MVVLLLMLKCSRGVSEKGVMRRRGTQNISWPDNIQKTLPNSNKNDWISNTNLELDGVKTQKASPSTLGRLTITLNEQATSIRSYSLTVSQVAYTTIYCTFSGHPEAAGRNMIPHSYS